MTSWRDQLNDLLALARKHPSPVLQRLEAMLLNYEQGDPVRRFIELALAALKDALIERNIYQDFYRDVLGRARLASAQRLPATTEQNKKEQNGSHWCFSCGQCLNFCVETCPQCRLRFADHTPTQQAACDATLGPEEGNSDDQPAS